MTTLSRENRFPQYADPLAGVPVMTKEWHDKLMRERENEAPEITQQRKEWRSKIYAEAERNNEMAWQVIERHRRERIEKEQKETQSEPQS